MTLIIISGGIDLAVGSTIALTVVIRLGIKLPAAGLRLACRVIHVGGWWAVGEWSRDHASRGVPYIAYLGMLGVGTRRRKWLAKPTDSQHAGDVVNELPR
jgi:predicted ABC-type sugar transport system permease subunit